MEYLLVILLQWVSQNSTYNTANIPPPNVIQLTAAELTAEFYSGAEDLIPADEIDERIFALYARTDGPNGTIYVLDANLIEGASEFEDPLENPLFKEILIHELTHHIQVHSGISDTWECMAYGEQEAYRLGGTYLKQLRVTDPLPNRNFWGAIYSRC